MATTNSLVVEQIEQKEPQLPSGFVAYVESKLAKNGSGGRPHIVKQLNSMDKVLEVLKVAWCEGKDIGPLSKSLKVSYHTVWRFLEDIKEYKNEIIEYITYQEKVKPKDFKAYNSVVNWRNKILLSGHLSALNHFRYMEKVCNGKALEGYKINPDKFDLEEAQKFLTLYITSKGENPNKHYIMAIRHFLMCNGIAIPRGLGGQYGLSGEKQSYGRYAHIKLSDDQINQVKSILESNNEWKEKGFDIGFRIGVETCTRAWALSTIPKSRITKEGNRLIIQVFEPKVKEKDRYFKRLGKWWRKYISKDLWERVTEYMESHKERECLLLNNATEKRSEFWLYGEKIERIVNDKKKSINLHNGFTDALKFAYKQIGITEPYFYEHAIHTLRHIGAHRLLRLTNYNYEIVAKLGGWTTPQIVRDCYGEMPDDVIFQVLDKVGF